MSEQQKKRSRVADYLVYLVLRSFVCIVQALPFRTALSLGKFLGWLAHRVDKRHREVARENLEKAFPGQYSSAEIDRIVRAVYDHFCTMVIEIIHLPRMLHYRNRSKYMDLSKVGPLVECALSGRPLLIVTGHHGNWEMAGYSFALLGYSTNAIARPLDNPYVDDFLRSFRERTGQGLLAKHGDFDRMEKILRDGGVIATLADQDAGQRGLFVDFFGRPASTHKAVALLALEHNVPMLVISTFRKNGKYHVVPVEVIDPADYARTPDAIKAMTQRFTSHLESLIRQAPEQYFWVHRRWKHQPQVRVKKQKAA